MEAIYFVLGVITVLSIGAIVIAIKVLNNNAKMRSSNKEFEQNVKRSNEIFELNVNNNFDNVYHRIDDKSEMLSSNINSLYDEMIKKNDDSFKFTEESNDLIRKDMANQFLKTYKDMDSRLDKLENKLTKK